MNMKITATESFQGPAAALGCSNLWRGDARMNRAVQCKLSDPLLSLEMALRKGGFCYAPNATGTTLDDEKVSMRQRKNQLSRRVRQAKRDGQQQSPQPAVTVSSTNTSSSVRPLTPISGSKRPADETADLVLSEHVQKAPRVTVSPSPSEQQPEITPGYVVVTVLMPFQGSPNCPPQEFQGTTAGSATSSVTNSIVDDTDSWDNDEEPTPFDQAFSSDWNLIDDLNIDPLLLLDEVHSETSGEDFGCALDEQISDDASSILFGGNQGAIKNQLPLPSEPQDDPTRLQRALDRVDHGVNSLGHHQTMGCAGSNSQESCISSPRCHQFAPLAMAEESERLVNLFLRARHENVDLARLVCASSTA